MAEEILAYLRTSKGATLPYDPRGKRGTTSPLSNKKIYYNSDEIQERNSVLCGYWCLYYLRERQMGTSMLDTIHNPKFDPIDHSVNHKFLINYFKEGNTFPL